MNVVERLNALIRSSKTHLYKGDEIRVLNFTDRVGSYTLDVEINGQNKTIEKGSPILLENFLNQFKTIEYEEISTSVSVIPPAEKVNMLPDLLRENKEVFKSIGEMLVEDIKKVRENAGYVPQAKQAANSAQAFVNLVKVQLEIIKH